VKNKSEKIKSLDILRFFAIILVMCSHYEVLPILKKVGWIGVDLFFVLSGFLVSGLLFKEYKTNGKIDSTLFLIRRGFKIYPTFWLVTFLYLQFYQYREIKYTKNQVFAELFFFQNFSPGLIGITWTIAIEEHFYFLLVIIVHWITKKKLIQRHKLLLFISSCILMGCLTLRTYLSFNFPFNLWTHFFPTYLRIDALFFGVILSWLYHFNPIQYEKFVRDKRFIVCIILCLGLLFPIIYKLGNPILNSIGLTALYISFGGLLSLLVVYREKKFWDRLYLSGFIYIGRFSYSIYLIHILVGPWIANTFRIYIYSNGSNFLYGLINILGNIFFGVLLSLTIEQFFLKLRERFFPKKFC
jgi:peptidoglycan/LPS O-acetylase OafA/YrhL